MEYTRICSYMRMDRRQSAHYRHYFRMPHAHISSYACIWRYTMKFHFHFTCINIHYFLNQLPNRLSALSLSVCLHVCVNMYNNKCVCVHKIICDPHSDIIYEPMAGQAVHTGHNFMNWSRARTKQRVFVCMSKKRRERVGVGLSRPRFIIDTSKSSDNTHVVNLFFLFRRKSHHRRRHDAFSDSKYIHIYIHLRQK